jgi:uncharacterized membrane protein
MDKGRLEAFSDGVLAIIITIMVLELDVPDEADLTALRPLVPTVLSYILSFIYLGIYWTNHHHLFRIVKNVNGRVLWANLHLLFWLSLIPFATGWLGKNPFAVFPVVCYGVVLLLAAIAYLVLTRALVACHLKNPRLAAALGRDRKGKVSIAIHAGALVACMINPRLAYVLYVLVAFIWLIPDRRIERTLLS